MGYAPNSHLTAPWVKLLINFDSTRVLVSKSHSLNAERRDDQPLLDEDAQHRYAPRATIARPNKITSWRIEHEWIIWWWRLSYSRKEAGRFLAPPFFLLTFDLTLFCCLDRIGVLVWCYERGKKRFPTLKDPIIANNLLNLGIEPYRSITSYIT